MRLFGVGVAAFLLAGTILTATPLEDKAKAFSDAVTAAIKASPNASGARGSWLGTGPALVIALQDDNQAGQAEMAVAQLMAQFPETPEVQSTGQALLDFTRAERKAKEDALTQRLTKALAPLPETLKQAKSPADLDASLKQLQEASGPLANRGGGSTALQQLVQQARNAFQFTQGWQDYLSNLQAGNIQEAQGNLRMLASRGDESVSLIPRSDLLARINELGAQLKGTQPASKPAPVDPFAQIKTLDDLVPAAAAAKQKAAGTQEMGSASLQALDSLAGVYGAVKAGVPATLQWDYGSTPNSPDYFRVKAMVLLYVLPRYLQGAPEPGRDESPRDYLRRVAGEAGDKGDWQLLKKALEVQRGLRLDSFSGQATSSNSLSSLQAAFHQDEAGQYALAVQSYQQALRADDPVPAKLIGQRLDAIKKDHPQEYEQGMQLVLTPPVPRYAPGYPPGYPPSMMPGQQAAVAQPAPIVIPGAAPKAVQTPAP